MIHRSSFLVVLLLLAFAGTLILGYAPLNKVVAEAPLSVEKNSEQSAGTETNADLSIEEEKETVPVEEIEGTVAETEDVTNDAPDEAAQKPNVTDVPNEEAKEMRDGEGVFSVPFYSQFTDITSPSWKKVGCGIASLAMIIEFHNPGVVSVDVLLQEGIAADAFLTDAGWTYRGLIGISKKYGLTGESIDMGASSVDSAYNAFSRALTEGPVMASVHYTFDPKNPIPHLVIINGIKDGLVYYNDPAEESGGQTISEETFKKAWKKRYLTFHSS